jgi:light-regulated signal transduction histidine kinase (bacteriophytochrome)
MGMPRFDVLMAEDRQKAMDSASKQATEMPAERQSYRIQLPGGAVKHIEMSVSALKDATGNVTGFVIVMRDVTERIKLEEEIQKILGEVKRSNTDLEQFAYVASHDLQEPLRMVASYLGLLAKRYKGKLDTEADEFIGFAVDGATRMQRMIQDLLTYSRVTTQGKALLPVELDVTFSEAMDNLKIAIDENKATVTHDHLPKVMADASQMVRLFQNLVSNALKFHGKEPPVIHVGCKEGSEEWTISVKDNGIGIDPKQFNRLFIIFQRLVTREQYPGTGIGLAVCKRTVERHGGRIWVESEGEGKGTTFLFTLPKKDFSKTEEVKSPEPAAVPQSK